MVMSQWDPRSNMDQWGQSYQVIEILQLQSVSTNLVGEVRDGAVWETEPKESTELDIYYEASAAIPVNLNENNNRDLKNLFLFLFRKNNINHDDIFYNAKKIIFIEENYNKIEHILILSLLY